MPLRRGFGIRSGIWPTGKDGDLHVLNGQTYTLTPGASYDFRNVTVDAGGKIEVDTGVGWVMLGVAANLVIDGEIISRASDQAVVGGATLTQTSPDGRSLTYTFPALGAGGGGGSGSDYAPFIRGGGGSGAFGNGGGGGTSASSSSNGDNGHTAIISKGGDSAAAIDALGHGAPIYGNDGEPGSGDSFEGFGGGGGSRGLAGGPLYIRINGNLSGSGSISVAGSPGGNGGYGGDINDFTSSNSGGGGGGGGAGGCGGKLIVKYGSATFSNYDVSGGNGGTGGGAQAPSSSGSNGANGATGVLDAGSL